MGLTMGLTMISPAWAHDAKDPVCRMTTDTDTTPYRETINGKTYYFCSEACKAKFDRSPSTYVTLADKLAAGQKRVYTLALTTPPRPVAGQPVSLTFTIRETPSAKVVSSYEVVHTKRLHLLLVSADQTWFEHQHPVLGRDGRFRLSWTFPRPGRYFLFADFTPTDGDNQILRATLNVGGKGQPLPLKPDLSPDTALVRTVGDTRVRLVVRHAPGPLRAGQQAVLTYTFTDLSGKPRTDMQIILGVMGHLIALRDDDKTLVHTHALHGVESGSYGAAMLAMRQAGQNEVVPVTADMVTPTGPALSFKLTLPKPGTYRVWAQFQRQNRWITVPFTLTAK